jgi:hypothetical protein
MAKSRRSGGVNVDANGGQVGISGDSVGRDKNTNNTFVTIVNNRIAVYVTVVVIILVIASIATALVNYSSSLNLSGEFTYLVRVRSESTGIDIPNAKVRIEVANASSLQDITDGDGIAHFSIQSLYVGALSRIIVTANSYAQFELYVDLRPNALPLILALKPNP